MALGNNKHQLMYRIKRILKMPVEKNRMSLQLLALLFFTMLFAVTGSFLNKKVNNGKSPIKKSQQAYQASREIFYLSPDEFVKKAEHPIQLKENKRELKIEVIKEDNNYEFNLLNEKLNNDVTEKVFFENVPQEWSIKTEELPFDHYFPHIKDELFKKQFYSDQFVYSNEHKEKAGREWKRIYENRSTAPLVPILIPKTPMNFYFNEEWGTDSIHVLRELLLSELFAEKGIDLLTEMFERELPKLERNKKQM